MCLERSVPQELNEAAPFGNSEISGSMALNELGNEAEREPISSATAKRRIPLIYAWF